MNTVAPWVAGGSALGMAGMAPSVGTALGRYGLAVVQTGKYGDKIIKVAPHVKDFIEGVVIPGPPVMTVGGVIGGGAAEVKKRLEEGK